MGLDALTYVPHDFRRAEQDADMYEQLEPTGDAQAKHWRDQAYMEPTSGRGLFSGDMMKNATPSLAQVARSAMVHRYSGDDRVVSPPYSARSSMVHRYSSALNFRNADAAGWAPVTGMESVLKRAYGDGVVGERSGLCGVASHGGNRTCTHICQLVRTFDNSVWGYSVSYTHLTLPTKA